LQRLCPAVLLTRFRDGKIVEHVEYFDPMRVIEMIKTLGG
jgi:ketosteroid isomerase-like protein